MNSITFWVALNSYFLSDVHDFLCNEKSMIRAEKEDIFTTDHMMIDDVMFYGKLGELSK